HSRLRVACAVVRHALPLMERFSSGPTVSADAAPARFLAPFRGAGAGGGARLRPLRRVFIGPPLQPGGERADRGELQEVDQPELDAEVAGDARLELDQEEGVAAQ